MIDLWQVQAENDERRDNPRCAEKTKIKYTV